jgi:nucleoside phosphorylase
MIAVTFALPAESSGFVAQLRDKEITRVGDATIIRGKIDNHSVAILHTGVGRKSCEGKIDNFLQAERPTFLIGAGFAGAVREHLQAGDLILTENFSDREWLSEAQRILSNENVRTAKLYTSPTIVDSIDERNEAARAKGADAVEMEAESIARACAARGVRMLSLRVISDSLRNPFPAPPKVLFDIQRQKTDPAQLLFYLLKHPVAIWRLIQFGGQIRKARQKLTSAIVMLIKEL